MIQDLLTEKLRPKKLEHMILPERIRDVFKDDGLGQNVLFAGSAGLGKTSLAKVLALPYANIFINVSDESSVDTIRDKINSFCLTRSILDVNTSNSFKVVILDEIDGASPQFYKALRGTIEKFASHTRFIATCNHINNVPVEVQSRFEVIYFDPVSSEEEESIRDDWKARVKLIINTAKMNINEEALEELTKRNFPDMRRTLNKIQSWIKAKYKDIDLEKVRNSGWSFVDLYELIMSKPNPVENYKVIAGKYSAKVDDVMESLGSDFIDWIVENHKDQCDKIPLVVVKVAEHQAQRKLVIDPVVSLLSLVYQIEKIIHS